MNYEKISQRDLNLFIAVFSDALSGLDAEDAEVVYGMTKVEMKEFLEKWIQVEKSLRQLE